MSTDPCSAERSAWQQAVDAVEAAAQATEKYGAAKPLCGNPPAIPPDETDEMIRAYRRLKAAEKDLDEKLLALAECEKKHQTRSDRPTSG
jgi:hypothetical protein